VAERDAEKTRKEKERKNQIRRTQLTAIVMAIGCLAATIAGAIAWNAKRDADTQKQIALAATAEAVRLRDGAIVLKNEADRQKGIAEGNLVEVNKQKAITDKGNRRARQKRTSPKRIDNDP
jgi:flagellar basal body-associated protein FliL